MSFKKYMKCYFCENSQCIQDVGFPEVLYDLILKYNIDQLFWVCRTCKQNTKIKYSLGVNATGTDSTLSLPGLNKEIKILKEDVTVLKENLLVIKAILREKTKNLKSISFEDIKLKSEDHNSSIDTYNDSGSETSSSESIKDVLTSRCSKERVARKHIVSILNSIKINAAEETECKRIVLSVLHILESSLKKDSLFSLMFRNFYYTGSSFNNLRIIEPTEYDINLVLQVSPQISLTPEFFENNYGFGKLKWKVAAKSSPSRYLGLKFFESNSENGYLQPRKVLSWFQRYMDLFLQEKIEFPPHVIDIKCRQSGPARTMIIFTSLGYEISLDLVPVFEFGCSALSNTPILDLLKKTGEDLDEIKWFTVPKGTKGEFDLLVSESENCWRLDFPDCEKHILHNKPCAKAVIKILKHLRDIKDWKHLASYYLKMVVLLEVIKNPSPSYWDNSASFNRLLDAMKQLKTYLENQYLPHFLTQQNLLHGVNKEQGVNWSNHLQRIISAIESHPNSLPQIFQKLD